VKRLLIVAALLAVIAPAASAEQPRPWLWQCDQIGNLDVQWRCYVRLLLEDIDKSGNPAAELPRIDRRARTAGTSLEGMCHGLMHEVGHHVIQHRARKLSPVMRTVDHERRADSFAAECRRAWTTA